MPAPLTATTSSKPGILQGTADDIRTAFTDSANIAAEVARRKAAAQAEATAQNVELQKDTEEVFADITKPTKFRVRKPGMSGALDAINPLTPTNFIEIGPQAPEPELTTGPAVPPTPSKFDEALGFKPDVQAMYADAIATLPADATATLPAAQRISAGGYAPSQVGESADYDAARKMSENAKNDVLEKRDAYIAQSLEARNKQTDRLAKDVAAEGLRMGRLKTAGEDLTTLNQNIKDKQEAFKVDPNRLFGQGAQRAATTFALGLQNIMSNVGEAMQGKAGTNAVLALVRDRVAQDIGLQENDYQRMKDGFQVQRNGLMDTIAQVGNERAGAEALAKQQGLAYADQLTQLAESTGYAKSKEAYPLLAAAAEIRMKLAQAEQQRGEFNVGAKNQAKLFGAQSAQSAQIANAQLESARQAAVQQLESARQAAVQQYIGLRTQVSDYDRKKSDDITSEAGKAHLGEQYTLLNQIGVLASNPLAAKELGGLIASFQATVGRSPQPGAISQWLASASSGTISASQQQILDLIQQYRGLKETGMGGKAISGIEDFLFNDFSNATPDNISRKVENARLQLVNVRDDLYKRANFDSKSAAGAYLANGLAAFVPDMTSQVAQPPGLQTQSTKEGK